MYVRFKCDRVKIIVVCSTLSWADIRLVQAGRVAATSLVLWGSQGVCRWKDKRELHPGTTDASGLCWADGRKQTKDPQRKHGRTL